MENEKIYATHERHPFCDEEIHAERDAWLIGGLALLIAAVILVIAAWSIFTDRAHAQGVGFIPPGTWLTTEAGDRVCQTTYTIARGTPIEPGFCTNWQPPFRPVMRGQQYPIHEGWLRWAKPFMSEGNHLQFHTEQGWKP